MKARNKPQDKEHESRLCVATTHILYNPKRGDVKLAQLQMLLANIDRLAFKGSQMLGEQIVPQYYPTILCGDFNCVNDSKLYEFMSTGKLQNFRELNRNEISGQFETSRYPIYINEMLPKQLGISDQSQYVEEVNKRMNVALSKSKAQVDDADNFDVEIKAACWQGGDDLAHNFKFKSVYKHVDEDNIPEVTTCVHDFKKTVDYIFYHSEKTGNETSRENNNTVYNGDESNSELKLVGRLGLFNSERVGEALLPERNYPSDHFALAAKFALETK